MTHPYATLIAGEATRVEEDLAAFRTRALSVVTTSSGIVTVLTGTITFAASKNADDAGVPNPAVGGLAVAMVCFVAAAALALRSNAPVEIDQPVLAALTEPARWDDGDSADEHERVASRAVAAYVESVRKSLTVVGGRLAWAIRFQIAGIAAAGLAATITFGSL